MEAAPQIQMLSITNQAMDWRGIAVVRSLFHTTCAYILHLMCPVVAALLELSITEWHHY